MSKKITSVVSLINTFAIIATCLFDVNYDIWIPSLVCGTDMTFFKIFNGCLFDVFGSRPYRCARWARQTNVREVTKGCSWNFFLYSFIILIEFVSIDIGLKESYISLWVLGCVCVPSFLVTSELQVVHAENTFPHTRLSYRFGAEQVMEKEVFCCIPSRSLSCTNLPRRIFAGDFCGESARQGAKGGEHAWA